MYRLTLSGGRVEFCLLRRAVGSYALDIRIWTVGECRRFTGWVSGQNVLLATRVCSELDWLNSEKGPSGSQLFAAAVRRALASALPVAPAIPWVALAARVQATPRGARVRVERVVAMLDIETAVSVAVDALEALDADEPPGNWYEWPEAVKRSAGVRRLLRGWLVVAVPEWREPGAAPLSHTELMGRLCAVVPAVCEHPLA